MTSGHPDWLYSVLGWTLTALGGGVVLWALFWDRARGRRRCAKCWYDMSATAGLRCPECGREATRERGLKRTRRKWRWAAVGVIVLAGAYATSMAPAVRDGGWPVLVPTWFITSWWPTDADAWFAGMGSDGKRKSGDRVLDDFVRRCLKGSVSASDARRWMRRAGKNQSRTWEVYDIRDLVAGTIRDAGPQEFRPDFGPPQRTRVKALTAPEVERDFERLILSVDPEGWTANGGATGDLAAAGGFLAVRTTQAVHRGVAGLLGAVRDARFGEPAAADPDEWTRGRAALLRLAGAKLQGLGADADVGSVVHAAAEAAGLTADIRSGDDEHERSAALKVPIHLDPSHLSALDALDRAAEAYGKFRYRIASGVGWTISQGRLVMGPPDELPRVTVIRVYDISPLLTPTAKDPTADRAALEMDLIRSITDTIDPDNWVDNGGDVGSVRYTPRLLVIRNSTRNHLAIEQLLNRLAGIVKNPAPPTP